MRTTPLRSRLVLLAVVGILPLAVLSGINLLLLLDQQREQAERAALEIARALGTAVDVELRRTVSVLEILATSPPLDDDTADGFTDYARRAVAVRPQWRSLLLTDPAGRPLVNAGEPDDAQSRLAASPQFAKAANGRTSAVGTLVEIGPREFGIDIHVPVLREGALRYVLTAVVKPDAILQVVNRQRVPSNWVIAVFDSNRIRVARSRGHEQYLGSQATPSLAELLARGGNEGTGISTTLEGNRVHTAYSRLPDMGWVVAIGIDADLVAGSTSSSVLTYGIGVLLSIVLGLLAALAVARSISRPIAKLRIAAKSLGRGEPPALPHTRIQEIQEVADELFASADERAQGEAERETLLAAERAARAAAEQARRRLELLAFAGTSLSRSLDLQATLDAIATIMVPSIADWCRVDLIDADGVLQRALAHHADPGKARDGMDLVKRLRAAPDAVGSMAWAAASGHSHLAHFDPPAQFDAIRDRDLLTFAETIGMTAYFIVPLTARGRTLGALAALQAESGRRFSPDDCALITELAQRASLAIDNSQLYAEGTAALREADRANRAKDEFLAMLGHELRNPLAPIVTALHLMDMKPEAHGSAERKIIERQVAHLSRLVDDLLDVSRITQGKIVLRREPVAVAAVIDRALELTQPLLEKRLHPVEVVLPDAPVFVSADMVRLCQVLCNLLINAAKFTPPEGRIALRVMESADWVDIAIEDTGRGIAPDLLPGVFDLFVQGEQSLDRNAGGLGLGLAIARTLVQMHGGSVGATSPGVGRGSTFTVHLPTVDSVAATDSAPPHAAAGPAADGTRILVVDDNTDAAETIALLLQSAGYDARTADDGPQALALIDTFRPALAILDIGLPGMDGHELARRLRDDPRLPNVRVIALTGYGREPDRMRALAVFEEHLVKPVAPERLLDAVARLLNERDGART